MPIFSEQLLEEIKARNDIVDVIGSRIKLKRSGSDYKACCPFHHEKTPSFIVSPSRRSFHCFGCGVHGDIFKFAMLSDGMSFKDAVKSFADKVGIIIEEKSDPLQNKRKILQKIHSDITAFFQRCLNKTNEAAGARRYLEARGLSPEIIEQFRLGYSPEDSSVIEEWAAKYKYDLNDLVEAGILSAPREDRPSDRYFNKFHGRLIFPITDQSGQVIAFSGRVLKDDKHAPKYYNSPETPIFRKSRTLYGLCFAKKNITRTPRREALICEGQIDVIRCHSCGFGTAVASQGTAFTEEHVSLLKAYADSAVLVFDGDAAGIKAASRTGRLFLEAGIPIKVATLPKGEDPDSILKNQGAEVFQEILSGAVSLVAFQIKTMQALEASPNSIDAVSRITSEIFETFNSCTKEVLKSCLIQEAADLLKIPLSAIEADYKAFQNYIERRQRWGEESSLNKKEPEVIANNARGDNPPPLENMQGGEELTQSADDFVPSPVSWRPPKESALIAIAEILVKISDTLSLENREIIKMISKWLPEMVLGSGPEKTIILSAISDFENEGDILGQLANDVNSDECCLINYLATRPSKIFISALPIENSVQDLIVRVWIDYLNETKNNSENETEDGQLFRLRLANAIKRLESAENWNSKFVIIGQLLP